MASDRADDETQTDLHLDGSGQSGPRQPPAEVAYLVLIAGPGLGQMHKLKAGETVIGRDTEADLRVADDGVSRRHALLVQDGASVILRDLGSTNGTFCNGLRVGAAVPLKDGDKIMVGATTILKFTYQDHLDEQFQRQMYESAVRDVLTRLFNRRHFAQQLVLEHAFSVRHGSALTVILLDIDHFKRVNDTFGHPAGDFVLREVARRVVSAVRAEDLVARYGGEELAVLCRQTTLEQGQVLAERLRAAVGGEPVIWAGQTSIPVTASLGVATMPAEGINGEEELVKAADRALYQAKHAGRNRVVAWNGR
ncbi:MAG TPA: GGDEF domain-containing protein [Polyangia bacterium]|nr:GGDEF domain-containing protein [Polyangia bacterium]